VGFSFKKGGSLMNKENKVPTPLSVMLGVGESIPIKGKSYTIKPMLLADVEKFVKCNISLGNQLYNFIDEKSKKNVDEFITKYFFDDNDNPISLEKVLADGWDVVDLKNTLRKLCDISG